MNLVTRYNEDRSNLQAKAAYTWLYQQCSNANNCGECPGDQLGCLGSSELDDILNVFIPDLDWSTIHRGMFNTDALTILNESIIHNRTKTLNQAQQEYLDNMVILYDRLFKILVYL